MSSKDGSRTWPELGRRVAAARRSDGRTQAEVARAAGFATSYMGLIESGKRRPRPEQLKRLAHVLSQPEEEFLQAAEYTPDEVTDLPPGVVRIVRRLVARGLGEQAFAKLERVAAATLLTDETDTGNKPQDQTGDKRRQNRRQRPPEDQRGLGRDGVMPSFCT